MRRFPLLAARDLEGTPVELPSGFSGDRNLVMVAFRREQQTAVDAWIAKYTDLAADHPGLRAYEVPVLATKWSPGRAMIDGGMAKAVATSEARRRTLTVYGDVRRVTDGLGIDDTSVITVLLVDDAGRIMWRTTGAWTVALGDELLAALEHDDASAHAHDGHDGHEEVEQFTFEFDPRYKPLLALLGVTPGTATVTLDDERIVARFGPWSCETPVANVREVCTTGPYRGYRAIGARGSMVDRGLTFGSSIAGGVCMLFREPVRGLDPFGLMHHPGLTVTVADREGFATSLRRRAGLVPAN
jgi:hypothetical protein